jgi:hypothetical protein
VAAPVAPVSPGAPRLENKAASPAVTIPPNAPQADDKAAASASTPNVARPDTKALTGLPGNASNGPPSGTAVSVITGPGNVQISTNNVAGLRLDLNGSSSYKVGDKLVLKVTAQKPGYLVVVDIAADGRITQIYPNVISLVSEGQKAGEANYLKAGSSILVPDPESPLTNFDFLAAPPLGGGLLVAMLSDKPVQIVDLPDVPQAAQKLEYVQEATRSLKITPAGGGPLLDPKWSFDAKAYTIAE